jgi:LacI family transcriptional regulator
MERVKLTDIARATGVSVTTVSLVFNNRPGIPTDTRQRVLEAAERLGYRSDRYLSVRNGSILKRVGLALKVFEEEPSISNPFYSVVVHGIESACRLNDTRLLYSHVHVDLHNRPVETIKLYDDVDGLILVGMHIPDGFVDSHSNLPVVLIDGYSEGEQFDSVVSRNFDGAYASVKYLIKKGHREIGMVAARPNSYPSLDERRAGFFQALLDHNLPHQNFIDCEIDQTGAEYTRAATTIFTRYPQITALFCPQDTIAVKALRAAQDLGKKIPDDLSIMGFDGIELSGMVRPGITTMALNQYNMGQLAVRLLQQRALTPQFPQIISSVPYQLIERESTRAVDKFERR